jgi:tyrosyl-tRNA synthetase
MLLQAYDFTHLHRAYGVDLQMGGADQWGNITAGLELIRRTADSGAGDPIHGAESAPGTEPAHGLAYPLLLSPSGAKFGKSEGGDSVWLDAALTSPFAFYQYWLNADDRDVPIYLRWFTLLSRAEIERLEESLASKPEARAAQRALALDVTARTHGRDTAERVRAASEAAFAREPIRDAGVLETMFDELERFEFSDEELARGAGPLAVAAGAFASNGDARRQIANGALSINGERIGAWDSPVPDPVGGRWLVLRVGRRNVRIGRRR